MARVDAWLKERIPALAGRPEISQYSGGASNWTYRLRYENRDLVLRRPPAGTKAKSAHDMGREFRTQKALAPEECEDVSCFWGTPPIAEGQKVDVTVTPNDDGAYNECKPENNDGTVLGVYCKPAG